MTTSTMIPLETSLLQLTNVLQARGQCVATAESCTGGQLAQLLTSLANSSQWFERGWVTYSNQAKMDCLDVEESLLDECGAVSEEVAKAMALGALRASEADWTIAITGIAGPSGGSAEKPIGTVWIAWANLEESVLARCYELKGDRTTIREQAVSAAMEGLLAIL